MTLRELSICIKYSAPDINGFVHCNECPLRIGDGLYDTRCRANSAYNPHTHNWEYVDEPEQYVLNYGKRRFS